MSEQNTPSALPHDANELSANRYFVPVCLYPHTTYRTRNGLTELINKFSLADHDHLIVVADHLLALDNLVNGRFWNPDMVYEKARRQGSQIFRLIKKTAKREESAKKNETIFLGRHKHPKAISRVFSRANRSLQNQKVILVVSRRLR